MGRMGPAGVFEWFWLIVVDGWIMMLKEVDVVRSTTTMPHACRHDRGARMTFTFDAGLLPFACFASLSREGSNSYVGSQETASARMVAKAETTDRRRMFAGGACLFPPISDLSRNLPCGSVCRNSNSLDRIWNKCGKISP